MPSEFFFHLRVRFQGNERLLRLMKIDHDWHAELLVPGKTDWITGENPLPSPENAVLPAMKLDDCTLSMELPTDNVISIEMGRLMASGQVNVNKGAIAVELRSVRADYNDDIGNRRGKLSLADLKRNARQPRSEKSHDNEMER